MFKKRFATITSATLLILGASLSFITPPQTASAWSGSLPACSDIGDYTTALKSDSRYSVENTAYAVFRRDFNYPGNPILAVSWDQTTDNKLSISAPYGTYQINIPIGGGTTFIIGSDGSLTDSYMSGGVSWSPSDLNCISAIHDPYPDSADSVYQSDTYDGEKYEDPDSSGTGEIDSPPSDPCDWFDLVCVVQKVYLSVTNGFNDLMTWLGGITTNFAGPIIEAIVPGADNNTIFTDMFNSIKTSMDAKLGFLTYPFGWFGSFFANVQAISWTGGFAPSCIYNGQVPGVWDYCTISFVVWQGQSVTIDFGAMEKHLPTVWNISIIFIRFAFFIAIIEMLRRAYFRTVKD